MFVLLLLAAAAPTFYTGDKPRAILVSCAPLLVLAAGMELAKTLAAGKPPSPSTP